MGFPLDVRERALVACGRHCCLCHRFVGIKIELHHIKQKAEGGADTFENCIPLCFDCHGDMRSYDHKHPKGTKYTFKELVAHRDNWYNRLASTPPPSYTPASADLDKQVFVEIKLILPWKGVIDFVRTNNFAGFAYKRDRLDPLYAFLERCRDPAFEFLDADLEATRSELEAGIAEFCTLLENNAFSLDRRPEWSSIPQEWEFQQPSRFAEVLRNLGAAADRVCGSFDELARAGRRKLGV